MLSSTFLPGSSPPSPGFAPCAILICSSSALARYWMVTPKRPDAICLIAVRQRHEPRGIFAAFAGVALAADPVHRDRERLVRLGRQRAEAHRARAEALDDFTRRLDLLERQRLHPRYEVEQAAQRARLARFLVDVRRELLVSVLVAAARGHLQREDRLWIPCVALAAAAPVELAGVRQRRQLVVGIVRVGERMAPQ